MNQLVDRVVKNWKTTAGALLTIAGVIFASVQSTNPTVHWTLTGSAIIAGLTGLLAKDA